jgi:hypothetical protein
MRVFLSYDLGVSWRLSTPRLLGKGRPFIMRGPAFNPSLFGIKDDRVSPIPFVEKLRGFRSILRHNVKSARCVGVWPQGCGVGFCGLTEGTLYLVPC